MNLDLLQQLVDADAAVEFFDDSVRRFEESVRRKSGREIIGAATAVCESSQVAHILAAPSERHGEQLCRTFDRAARRFCAAASRAKLVLSEQEQKTLASYVSNVQTRVSSLAQKRKMRLDNKHLLGDLFSIRCLRDAHDLLDEVSSRRLAKSK